MQRNLSSAQTFFMKLVFPAVWIVLCGSIVLAAHFRESQASPGLGAFPFLIWGIGAFAMLWMCMPLKRVSIDDGNLYVSNYFREIKVPLAAIADVTENRWINIHPVTIHLKRDTEFGNRITFMPKSRMFSGFSSHPVVQELRRAAGLPAG
ncbi:hypothetical protein [Tahibacter caeni]|uniref:hypothetical protein n=1 Tax=Tahibacter caeni TaxID=1453545 RepID=UPI0021497018|nr:hypothetical protein [Tahibacter caeni]